ncbi:hypothetical protein B0J11DRAFT_590823 [Dendryphion nanum]|uniref:Uncharacterized protein n=1 Tax=Dendryphion nanum TaxID=256645 RepID=A0A9P9DII9_9PLEO|nr:hypothetical protein B0J11DRAFT_590823 [Dendryphion nanum]
MPRQHGNKRTRDGGSPELEAKRSKQGAQNTRRRRGGIHQVKDEHRTGTPWDQLNHANLKQACIERNIYTKDMPKHKMAQSLAKHDKEKKRQAKIKEVEDKKKVEEAKKRKEGEENRRKRMKRKGNPRRNRQAVTVDTEMDHIIGQQEENEEDEEGSETGSHGEQDVGIGDFESDEWESDVSFIETPTMAKASLSLPHQRLRIYEYVENDLLVSNACRQTFLTKHIPYLPLTLVTTISNQLVELPGRACVNLVGADFVPKLSQFVINCARNGVMVGTLRRAVIESGLEWASRTRIHDSAGGLYFHLPGRDTSKSLADVYSKWNNIKNTHTKRNKTGKHIHKSSEQKDLEYQRHMQAQLLDVYAHSEHRPPIYYRPAYLDYPSNKDGEEGPFDLGNLYYVRFDGNVLPHYYFWSREGEWTDPKIPNPLWLGAKKEDDVLAEQERLTVQQVLQTAQTELSGDSFTPAISESMIRTMKSPVPNRFKYGEKRLPQSGRFNAAIGKAERELFFNGMSGTLLKYQDEWVGTSNEDSWYWLTSKLADLYPSGKLPDAPPVLLNNDQSLVVSLAEKIARIEVPDPDRPVIFIHGNEPWTRDDDAYWDIEVISNQESTDEEDIQKLLRDANSIDLEEPDNDRSTNSPPQPRTGLLGWLQSVAWGYVNTPPTPAAFSDNDTVTSSSSEQPPRGIEREYWKQAYDKRYHPGHQVSAINVEPRAAPKPSLLPNHLAETDSIPVEALKADIRLFLDAHRLHDGSSYCRICYMDLSTLQQNDIRDHYALHVDDTRIHCPFCRVIWEGLNNEWRSAHISAHDFDDVLTASQQPHRHSSIPSLKSQKLFGMPAGSAINGTGQKKGGGLSPVDKGLQSRRESTPKVHFSPAIEVGRRVGYSDIISGVELDTISTVTTSQSSRRGSILKLPSSDIDTGAEPDLSSAATTPSPRGGSILKQRQKSLKTSDRTKLLREFDPEYSPPSTPSSHIPSPYLPHIQRYEWNDPRAAWDPRRYSTSGESHVPSPHLPHVERYHPDDPRAAWDPRKYSSSGESHVESPYLPRIRRYPAGHPNAAWDPNRQSVSTVDSLEWYTGPRKKRRGLLVTRVTKTQTSNRTKDKRRMIDEDLREDLELPLPELDIDPFPSKQSKENSSKRLTKTRKSKRCVEVGREPADSLAVLAPGDDVEMHNSTTVSNANTSKNARRRSALASVESDNLFSLEDIAIGTVESSKKSAKRKSVAGPSGEYKRRKLSNAITMSVEADHIPFPEDTGEPMVQAPEDIMKGDPFATLRKKSTSRERKSNASCSKENAKITSAKDVALDHKQAVAASALAAHRTAKKDTKEASSKTKTTISGRPFVKPLTLASAIKLGKNDEYKNDIASSTNKSNRSSRSGNQIVQSPSSDSSGTLLLKSATLKSTPTSKKKGSKERDTYARGRRSSAPTPSPSLSAPSERDSTASMLSTPEASSSKGKEPIRDEIFESPQIIIPKRHSYDIPFSEIRLIVPPNTPAVHIRRLSIPRAVSQTPKRRGRPKKKADQEYETVEIETQASGVPESELDVGMLSDKIGSVKTTRGGLARELPGGVVKSVLGKITGRGRKKKVVIEEELEPEIVEAPPLKKVAKTATKRTTKAATKPRRS